MAAVSVIVPVYNAEAYLERCIDSILSQSCPDTLEKGVEAVRYANPSAAFRGEDQDSPMENRLFRMRTIKAGEIYFTENDPLQDVSFLRQYLSGEERTGTSPIM